MKENAPGEFLWRKMQKIGASTHILKPSEQRLHTFYHMQILRNKFSTVLHILRIIILDE